MNQLTFKCIDRSNWLPDEITSVCMICKREFTVIHRRHHCRLCGIVICGNCSDHKLPSQNHRMLRVCNKCFANVVKSTIRSENDPNIDNNRNKSTYISSIPIIYPNSNRNTKNSNSPSTQQHIWKKSLKTTAKSNVANIKKLFGMKWSRGKVLTEDDIYQIVKDDIKDFEVEYNRLRDFAQEQLKQRDECHKKLIDIQMKYNNSNFSNDQNIENELQLQLTKELSEQGKAHHNLMSEANWKAARMIFSLRNPQLIIEDDVSDDDDSIDSSDSDDETSDNESNIKSGKNQIDNCECTSEGESTAQNHESNVLIIDLYGLFINEINMLFKEKINSIAASSLYSPCSSPNSNNKNYFKKKLNIINIGEGIPTILTPPSPQSSFIKEENQIQTFISFIKNDSDLTTIICNIQFSNENSNNNNNNNNNSSNIITMDLVIAKS